MTEGFSPKTTAEQKNDSPPPVEQVYKSDEEIHVEQMEKQYELEETFDEEVEIEW